MITNSVEIARPPQDVFAYLDQFERHGEWQELLEDSRLETEGPPRVGSRVVQTRKTPMGRQKAAFELTEHDPPSRAAWRGVDGIVRPSGSLTVEPTGDGSRSRVTLQLDLQGHGLGKIVAPLARRQAAKEVPKAQAKLKERLESGADQAGSGAAPA
jgi:uncharacterized membrane protein